MAYRTGSEAARLDGSAERRYREQPRRHFEVIEGAGLDARAREGVGAEFVRNVKLGIFIGVVLLAFCFGRVFLTSATVSMLKANNEIRSEIKVARSQRADLEVQRSVLASSERIDLIATQNLGMQLTSGTESVDVASFFAEQHDEPESIFEQAEDALSGSQTNANTLDAQTAANAGESEASAITAQ